MKSAFSRSQHGFSLLEVLIALLVFSLGLMGLAAMLVMSVRTNQGAYIRTQASFLAQSMADRMRANVARVWAGDYEETAGAPSASAAATVSGSPCTTAAGCPREVLAARDLALLDTQISALMPAGTTRSINCATTGPQSGYSPSTLEMASGAVYPGICTIVLAWTELSLNRATQGGPPVDTGGTPESLSWVFTP